MSAMAASDSSGVSARAGWPGVSAESAVPRTMATTYLRFGPGPELELCIIWSPREETIPYLPYTSDNQSVESRLENRGNSCARPIALLTFYVRRLWRVVVDTQSGRVGK